jgi:hypothetical protein
VRRRGQRLVGLLVLALLLALGAGSVLALQPPSPEPADAPAGTFSAARAEAHLQRIGAEKHVVGSPADDRVTAYLAEQLTRLGLDTQVQNAVGAWQSASQGTDLARVRNVVAVLPGSHSTGRLVLMAHHDSVQTGPGASDDGAGVSTLLETVRALTQGPRPRNDVVVVLTDGEEACLCGAEAFTASHPLAAGGGVVLNFEARGTGGPPIMFETSEGNEALAARFATAAPHPVATSFAVEVYRALPNDTDFTVMRTAGFTGLNTAYIDGAAAYHSPQDTPDRLNPGSLQAMGDNALALTRALAAADLRPLAEPATEDATYFPVLTKLLRYPGSWVWPVAAAAAVLVLLLAVVLRRRGESGIGATLGATALALLPLGLGPLAAQGLWLLLEVIRPGYAPMLDPWRPGWYRVGVVALVLAVVLIWYALLRRRIGPAALQAGALMWLAVVALALAALAPGGSYLTAWPAIAGALAGIVAALTGSRAVQAVAALLGGAVAVVVLAPTVALFLPALGMSSVAAPAFVIALLAVALLPALELLFPDVDERRPVAALAVPAVAVVLAAACAVAGLAGDKFDARHPVPSQLVYALDADSGHAWWGTTERRPGAYTARYVDGAPGPAGFYPYLSFRSFTWGDAQAADLKAPAVEVLNDRRVGDRREITVHVTPQRDGVRLIGLELSSDGGRVTDGRV